MISVTVDLRSRFGAARDQGPRPTCLAFGMSDLHAFHRDRWEPLSCEYLFYHTQRRFNRSFHTGASLSEMRATLEEEGQPLEENWPYLVQLPKDIDLYGPPTAGTVYRRQSDRHAVDLVKIEDALLAGIPVLVVIMLSDAFYAPRPDAVILPVQGDPPDPSRRHALILTGMAELNGEMLFLARNSWGKEWGVDGYAWLTAQFLQPRLNHAVILKEEVHVSA
ncbi:MULTISPECIES: C1 family peptidase [Sinorhizobium]|uniref:Peptidase C1A papain C-terminal domain-containing protein n=1 Tax=Sinorhizobium americanum TaxID=194963 RepID=A0A2S3YQH7_9HYPH|nr:MULTISPECIES: C1 family peptidase [Sinorhizobium]PDT34462.1 peptidase C1 [Sinorhizobium sp. FG01]POH33469.1 hypothetical protein ATY31_10585 [Sinorhizobium americanum]